VVVSLARVIANLEGGIMDDAEKLHIATGILREWIYELDNLDSVDSSDGADYRRLCENTEYFLQYTCHIDLENT
jgi:hypothetical protein